MKDTATIIFRRTMQGNETETDLEVPLDITANELIVALSHSYKLGLDVDDIKQCYLRCERPVVLLRGDRTLREFGVRDAMVIHFTK